MNQQLRTGNHSEEVVRVACVYPYHATQPSHVAAGDWTRAHAWPPNPRVLQVEVYPLPTAEYRRLAASPRSPAWWRSATSSGCGRAREASICQRPAPSAGAVAAPPAVVHPPLLDSQSPGHSLPQARLLLAAAWSASVPQIAKAASAVRSALGPFTS